MLTAFATACGGSGGTITAVGDPGPEALISLRSKEAAYQAALQVTARVIQPSLLDFLR